MAKPLTTDSVRQALTDLPDWQVDGDQITKTFTFGSFREAVGFIVRIAFEAEQINHHPDLRNVYNKVTIALSTHDAGGKVTQKDIDLAKAIERIDWS